MITLRMPDKEVSSGAGEGEDRATLDAFGGFRYHPVRVRSCPQGPCQFLPCGLQCGEETTDESEQRRERDAQPEDLWCDVELERHFRERLEVRRARGDAVHGQRQHAADEAADH